MKSKHKIIADSTAQHSTAQHSTAQLRIIGCMDNTMDNTFESANRVYDINGLAPTIPTCTGGGIQPKVLVKESIIVASRGRNPNNPSDRRGGIYLEQRLEPNQEDICNSLTTIYKDNMVLEKEIILIKQATKSGYIECEVGGGSRPKFP